MNVKEKYALIQKNIVEACGRTNRNSEEVTVIAVTKYVSTERAIEALEAGVTHFGENRAEGLTSKWERLSNEPTWHFIGSLQTRKVRNLIDKVSYIHSLDRLSLAEEIQKRANRKINCFVQVNVSGEESKQGISPDKVMDFIKKLEKYSNIQIVGLMTMAPLTEDEELLRSCFRNLKNLQLEVEAMQLPYAPCKELSMGMSNDYILAIEEGATFVRIGTALVGEDQEEG